MKKKIIAILIIVVVVAIVGLNVYRSRQEGSVPVRTAAVLQQDFEVSIFAVGRAAAGSVENVYSRTNGIIEKVLVEMGDTVHKGDILALFDTADLDRRLLEARVNLDARKAGLAEAQAGPKEQEVAQQEIAVEQARLNLEQAKTKLAQAESLYREGAVPLQEKESAQYEVSRREMELQAARERLGLLLSGQSAENL